MNCRTVLDTRRAIDAGSGFDIRMVSVRHEDFIAEPREQLERLCDFLELEATPDYLEACAAIVFESANKARFAADWTPELIDRVAAEIERFPFLAGYAYDS